MQGVRFIMTKSFSLILFLLLYNTAHADCAGSDSKTLKSEIFSCNSTSPSEDKELVKNLEIFKDDEITEILESYRGYELITSDGKLFVPISAGLTCSNIIIGLEANITVDYACCDGDPNPPCFLGYSEIVMEVEY
jgi:hypothetical protein